MALTFREQIEATAWELGNGEGTMPELRKRFDADPETPNFDPAKALEMLHILQLINYKQAGKGRGRARCHYLKKPEYGLLTFDEPNQTEIIELLKDDGSNARKTTVLTAINRLLEGGWISNRSGRNNRNIYASVRPYRQMDDPKSDAFVDRMSREEASELDKENHLEI